jgi:hypothetical protein
MSDRKFPPPTGERWNLSSKMRRKLYLPEAISSREDILRIFKI